MERFLEDEIGEWRNEEKTRRTKRKRRNKVSLCGMDDNTSGIGMER